MSESATQAGSSAAPVGGTAPMPMTSGSTAAMAHERIRRIGPQTGSFGMASRREGAHRSSVVLPAGVDSNGGRALDRATHDGAKIGKRGLVVSSRGVLAE